MSLPNYLATIKSSGFYRFVWDKSFIQAPQAITLRLMVGYSEKGPFNTLVYIDNPGDFIATFGNISKRLEKKGIFFHRSCLQALNAGPILVLNLKPFTDETTTYLQFCPATITEVDPTDRRQTNIRDVFDTNRFWFVDADQLYNRVLPINGSKEHNYITMAATDAKETSCSFFVRKYVPENFNLTFRQWYAGEVDEEPPLYMDEIIDDKMNDYFAEVYVFRGEFTKELCGKYGALEDYFDIVKNDKGQDEIVIKADYKNSYGEVADALEALAEDPNSRFIGKYQGITLPSFKNTNGTYISLDIVFNRDNYRHKILMKMNELLLDRADTVKPILQPFSGSQYFEKVATRYSYKEHDPKEFKDENEKNMYVQVTKKIKDKDINFQDAAMMKMLHEEQSKILFEGKYYDLTETAWSYAAISEDELDEKIDELKSSNIEDNKKVGVKMAEDKQQADDTPYPVLIKDASKDDPAILKVVRGPQAAYYIKKPATMYVKQPGKYAFVSGITAVNKSKLSEPVTESSADNLLVKDGDEQTLYQKFSTGFKYTKENSQTPRVDYEEVPEVPSTITEQSPEYIKVSDNGSPAPKYTYYKKEQTFEYQKNNDAYIELHPVPSKVTDEFIQVGESFYSKQVAEYEYKADAKAQAKKTYIEMVELPQPTDVTPEFVKVPQDNGDYKFWHKEVKSYEYIPEPQKVGRIYKKEFAMPGYKAGAFPRIKVGENFYAVGKSATWSLMSAKEKDMYPAAMRRAENSPYSELPEPQGATDVIYVKKQPKVYPMYMEGYTYTTITRKDREYKLQDKILSTLTIEKGIREALTNRVDSEYHYLVDTFDSYIETGCKARLAGIAKQKDNAFAILNFPAIYTFINDEERRFNSTRFNQITLQDESKFDITRIANKKNGFSLPSDTEGASWCGFFTQVMFSDGVVKSYVPSAALVSNNFVAKYRGRQPYYIVAGPNYGVIAGTGMVGPDYNYARTDLDVLEPLGVNAIIYVPRKGTYINSNQTAKQTPISALSKIHVRELVIYIQDEIEYMLQNYQWELNTQSLRDTIKQKADYILENVASNGGIYKYDTVCDETNNTPEVIDNEILLLDIAIEPARGAGKMVQTLTLHRTGGLTSK